MNDEQRFVRKAQYFASTFVVALIGSVFISSLRDNQQALPLVTVVLLIPSVLFLLVPSDIISWAGGKLLVDICKFIPLFSEYTVGLSVIWTILYWNQNPEDGRVEAYLALLISILATSEVAKNRIWRDFGPPLEEAQNVE